MHVDHTPDQKALRSQLRDYFAKWIPPDVRARLRGEEGGALQRRIIRRMGADGWLAVGWPVGTGVPTSALLLGVD